MATKIAKDDDKAKAGELPHVIVALQLRGRGSSHISGTSHRRQRLRVLRERQRSSTTPTNTITTKENVSYTVASIAWEDAAPGSSLLVMDGPDTTRRTGSDGASLGTGSNTIPRVVLCRSPYVCVSEGANSTNSTLQQSTSCCSCELLTRRVVRALCEPGAELLTCIVGSRANNNNSSHETASCHSNADMVQCTQCCSGATDTLPGLFAKVVEQLFAPSEERAHTCNTQPLSPLLLCQAVAVSVIEVEVCTERVTQGGASAYYSAATDLLSALRDRTPVIDTLSNRERTHHQQHNTSSSLQNTATGCFMERPCDIPATRYVSCTCAGEAIHVLQHALHVAAAAARRKKAREDAQGSASSCLASVCASSQLLVTLLVQMPYDGSSSSNYGAEQDVRIWKLWDMSTAACSSWEEKEDEAANAGLASTATSPAHILQAMHRASLATDAYPSPTSSLYPASHPIAFELAWHSVRHSCSTFMLLGVLVDHAACEGNNETVLETAAAWAELAESEACENSTSNSDDDALLSGLTRVLRSDAARPVRRRDNVAAAARVLAGFALSYADYLALITGNNNNNNNNNRDMGQSVAEQTRETTGNVFDVSTIVPSGGSSSHSLFLTSPTPPPPPPPALAAAPAAGTIIPGNATQPPLQEKPHLVCKVSTNNNSNSNSNNSSNGSDGAACVDPASLARLAALLTRSVTLSESTDAHGTTCGTTLPPPQLVTVSASRSVRAVSEGHKIGTSASSNNGMTPSVHEEEHVEQEHEDGTLIDRDVCDGARMAPCLRSLAELTAAIDALQQQLTRQGVMQDASQAQDTVHCTNHVPYDVPQAMRQVRQAVQRLSAQLCRLVEEPTVCV